MPGDPLKHVRSGETLEIKAPTWNAFIDAAQAHKANRQQSDRPQRVESLVGRLIVWVENTTGVDLDGDFPVLEIDGPVFNEIDRAEVVWEDIVLKGKAATANATTGNIAVLQGPCEAGGFRKAVIMGPTWCDISVTNAAHTHANPTAGSTAMVSGTAGAPILYRTTSTGAMKAVVSLSPAGATQQWSVVAKVRSGGIPALVAATGVPGTATVDLWAINTDVNPDVMVDLATPAVAYNVSTTAIPEGAFVPLVREPTSGQWIAVFSGSGSQAIIVKTSPGSGIDARDGVSLSSQSCEIFKLVEDVPATLTTTGEFETIYNVEPRPVPADEYFVAVEDKNSGLWVAVVPLGFDRCKCLVKGSFTLADSTFTVDNVIATKGRSPLSDPDNLAEELTVNNEFQWDGSDNSVVYIEWHQDDSGWYAYQVQCSAS